MKPILFALGLLGLAGQVQAYCSGTNLLPGLTEAERAKMDQATEAVPFATGNHWVARKGDQTIHVIGTMHLDDPRWGPVMPVLQPVVEDADLLFVEMTEADQIEMQSALSRQPEKVFITEGPTLPDLLSEEDWIMLRAAMAERGLPSFMAAKMQPWMQTLMLGMPACAVADPELAKRGLDMRLMTIAEEAGVPFRSLEGFEELYALIADRTIEEQLEMLLASLPFVEGSEDQFATTSALYFEERAAATWEFARVMSYRALDKSEDEIEALLAEFQTKLLDIRNAAWMEPILAAPEEDIVIAVGALHLIGETGILALLEQSGYSLERAPFRVAE